MAEDMKFDRIVVGRYASILTKDAKLCNEKLSSGMSMEEFIEFDYKHYNFYSHRQTPHLIVEYLVDGVLYYRALDYPRNSPILQKGYFGKEVMVIYSSENPWNATVRKDLNVEKELAERNLVRPDYSSVKTYDNMDNYGLGFTRKDGTSPISTPINRNGGATKKEQTALALSLISFIPPILGSASWVMSVIAFFMALNANKKEGANHSINTNTMIISGVAFVLGGFVDFILLGTIISIIGTIIQEIATF